MTALLESPKLEAVALVLRASGHPQLARLDVDESEFEVELTGRVASYYLKQVAQETIRETVAGRRLVNRVVVVG